ncbi:hypothetical protein GCM10023186_26000 [Hymenobacter koreensis]|uniref:Fibronectin type-III domain-containing protein n=2 Tax=Hymenobacter koreensis TaxID=1084523 RepID=A0ABP8J3S3_9BACT
MALLWLLGSTGAYAQVSVYSFTQTTGTYTAVTGGNVVGTTTSDDQQFNDPTVPAGVTTATAGPGLPIGFTFRYNGANHNVFAINNNGWIALGNSSAGATAVAARFAAGSNYTPLSNTSTSTTNIIAPLSRDLQAQAGGELSYQTIGTAPNRTLVVQWTNYRRFAGTGQSYNFQIRLSETTNVVSFVYGTFTESSTVNGAPQVGLRGATASDFLNRTAVATGSWAASTPGTLNTDAMPLTTTVFPASGLTYTFTPPSPTACLQPTNLAVTAITSSSAQLTFTAGQSATSYTVTYTPQGGSAQTATGTGSPITLTGLTPSTSYSVSVISNCGGSQSTAAASATFRTACLAAPYATLPVSETFENTWISVCGTNDVPTNNWRSTPSPTDPDASWRRDDDGAAGGWTSPTLGMYTPAGANGSARSARFHSYGATTGTIGTLDLHVNLSPTGAKFVTFDHINTSGSDTLTVHLSTDGGATFGPALARYTTAATWTGRTVALPTTASATAVIRLRARSDFSTTDIGIDNVQVQVVTTVPGCATNLQPANNATGLPRPVTISWAAGTGVPNGYDVYFGTTSTPPLVSANQSGTTYTPATPLAANTTYYYQVIPRNANGAATGCAVNQFTTSGTFAYCNTNLGDYCGTADITTVAIQNTSLNNAGTTCSSVNGSSYTSYPASGSTTATVSPGSTYQFAVTTAAAAILSVWIDYNQNGTFEATEWTQVTTTSTANQAATVSITIPTSAAMGQTGMRVRSRSTGSPNGASDACVQFFSGETEDYIITIAPAAPCTAPPTPGAATASNTSFCSPRSVTLGLQGASFGTGLTYQWQQSSNGTTFTNIAGATSSNFTTPILTATTYFRAVLTCSGQSATSTAVTVSLNAPTYATLPVIESFENNWVDGCGTRDIPTASWRSTPSPTDADASWRRDDDGAAGGWSGPTLGMYTPAASQGSRSARFHSYNASSGTVGFLDLYANLSAAGTKRLTFDFINTSGNDSLTVHLSTDGGVTFGPALLRLGQSGTVAAGFQNQTVNLLTTSATAVIRFRGRGDFGVTDIGLDNVRVESATGCLSPTNLVVSSSTSTSAVITWASAGSGTYVVEYGPSGFTLGSGTTIPVTGTTTTLTNLTAGVTYQVYVRQNCGGTFSGNAGPVTVSTGACPVPTAPIARSVTSSTAVLEWAGAASSTATFTVEYGLSGFTVGTGTVVTNITGLTTTLTNLAANTNYCYYVKQVCAPGSTSTSQNAGPICFRTAPTAALNNEPCGAPALTVNASGAITPVSGSNVGATFTSLPGIVTPACSPANAPRDIWYTLTMPANTTSLAFGMTGAATGMVRLYTAATCSTAFTQVACRASSGANQSVGNVTFTGLTAGTTYYLAISGYGNGDTQGNFTLGTVLSNRRSLSTGVVDVFPNPTSSGELSVRISGAGAARNGQATLINALGQVMRTQPLTLTNGGVEQKLSTVGLSTGVYTLRLQVGQELVTRQVVVE